jgi:hypothetical protein
VDLGSVGREGKGGNVALGRDGIVTWKHELSHCQKTQVGEQSILEINIGLQNLEVQKQISW